MKTPALALVLAIDSLPSSFLVSWFLCMLLLLDWQGCCFEKRQMVEEGDWAKEKCDLSLSSQSFEMTPWLMVVDNYICYFYCCVNVKTADFF